MYLVSAIERRIFHNYKNVLVVPSSYTHVLVVFLSLIGIELVLSRMESDGLDLLKKFICVSINTYSVLSS